jgi:hypothetical protein
MLVVPVAVADSGRVVLARSQEATLLIMDFGNLMVAYHQLQQATASDHEHDQENRLDHRGWIVIFEPVR